MHQCYAVHAHQRRDVLKREFSYIFFTLEKRRSNINFSFFKECEIGYIQDKIILVRLTISH